MKKKFAIQIIETLRKVVVVEARNADEAYQEVVDMYYNEEVILTSDDYVETNFEIDNDYDPSMNRKGE